MKLFFAMVMAMPLFSVAQNSAEPRFVVHGRVAGVADSSAVCITDVSNPMDTLSYAIVKNGVFVLAGHLGEPNLYEVNFLATKKKIPLFIGNDKMEMTGTVEDLKGIKVTGSASNDDFMEFQTIFNPYFMRLNVAMGLLRSPEGVTKQDSLRREIQITTDT